MEWNLRELQSGPGPTRVQLDAAHTRVHQAQAELDQIRAEFKDGTERIHAAIQYYNNGELIVSKLRQQGIHIHHRAYVKLWYLLHRYHVLEGPSSINTVHLCEAPGSFVQCTRDYWTKVLKHKATDWSWHAMTLADDVEWREPETGIIFADLTQDNLPPSCYHADLVTADGGIEEEKMNHTLLEAQLIKGRECVKVGGHLIVRCFDLFEKETHKLLLEQFIPHFRHVYLTKPHGSRLCSSERYLVGLEKLEHPISCASLPTLYVALLEYAELQVQALTKAATLARQATAPQIQHMMQASPYHHQMAEQILDYLELSSTEPCISNK